MEFKLNWAGILLRYEALVEPLSEFIDSEKSPSSFPTVHLFQGQSDFTAGPGPSPQMFFCTCYLAETFAINDVWKEQFL